ncbi:glycosyl hydrolase family 3 [Asticcacaulis sp. AC460]|uniref:glycoside hydrolase family 3 protein n=1 Tax=Asticcacaulis sp. AC460 TaxID=1282360 RepID=UPI0003C3CFA6|nr:glycoside hydrolase family 3 protein [Asticcacaulis sp. AC460]ESQ88962.1 glycosyl hydrolase family 3 [Asticcacaulis sp. AC460]
MSLLSTVARIALASVLFAAAPAVANEPLTDWPHITSAIPQDPAMEAKIAKMVAGMSLRDKVAQMTQVEIKTVTPQDIKTYQFGSVLNGGGSWPNMDKYATAKDWVAMADSFHAQAKIPLLWGTDAVHGHSNVVGATLFPHNIGLGAARDPELIREIAAATGKAVRATGVNWAFAPTLAVVEDSRWGRTYEGFSSDPQLIHDYAQAYIAGMQGNFKGPGNIVATAKHYIGDGGTAQGIDQGITESTESELINVHAQGYYGALEAGVQTVMVSYSSWTDSGTGEAYGKMHGNGYLVKDVLKGKMGFDGFVVSDWNAIGQIPGCTNDHCPQAINAGVDMIMVPFDWKAFIDKTVADVESGAIPMSRIDDAVTRILRVKMRAGLFGVKPSANPYAGKAQAMQARDLARRAVAETLVLLKNDNALPLKTGAKILVVGKSADNMANQSGGWSITWQGSENSNADYPVGDSVLSAIKAANTGGTVTYSATGADVDVSQYDVVVAVIGETPYAEGKGDIKPGKSLAHSDRYPEDIAALNAVSGKGKPVVTVFESGRTVYANDLINASDAFVAAWLPGTEGQGVTDVLFGQKDFKGVLPFAWPGAPCEGSTLFPAGYGLTYTNRATVPTLEVIATPGCPHAQSH